MDDERIIAEAAVFVERELGGETTGHDYWHSHRVWKNALHIAQEERGGAEGGDLDLVVVQLAALLHDVEDWKNVGDAKTGKVAAWLARSGVGDERAAHVLEIIGTLSFKSPTNQTRMRTAEGLIVQDADRLEALGAIGIARAFASGQKFGQAIHDPRIKPGIGLSLEEYRKQYTGERKNTTINHFYEKLLLLKDRMNTAAGRRIAEERHEYMEEFLARFYDEWDGKA